MKNGKEDQDNCEIILKLSIFTAFLIILFVQITQTRFVFMYVFYLYQLMFWILPIISLRYRNKPVFSDMNHNF